MGDDLEESQISLTKIFDEQCPYYLAIGMTYDEFWLENPFKVILYRKAYEIKSEIRKYEIWEQGAYFYESLAKTSVLFRDLAKKGSKPEPYPERPYGIKTCEKTEAELEEEQENERLKAKIHFDMLFKNISKRFESKAGENNE